MRKYILITGGELYNKGAQAMTFIAVDQMKKKYPDHEIVLFSHRDANRLNIDKEKYNFTFMPFPEFGAAVSLITGLRKNHYSSKDKQGYFDKYQHIFENAKLMLDISGYAIGSNWGSIASRAYLRRIIVAKYFKIPVFLMPQSFGPFNYSGKDASLIKWEIHHYFRYPKLIMAREQESLEAVKVICHKANVIKTYDMVLQTPEININNVYKSIPRFNSYSIYSGSVAIIPNSKNNKYGNADENEALYREIIDKLLRQQKHIYLLYHASEDKELCEALKINYYSEEDHVHFIDDELNCIEFENLVRQFEFVVASRYHSIVHSYKQKIPAIIIGWANKYQELSQVFHQEKYCFNVNFNNSELIMEAIDDLILNWEKESIIIGKALELIQSNSVFENVTI